MKFFPSVFLLVASAAAQSDYVMEVPPTVYESEVMSPQNMDFDRANNMFIAHAGWYNDQLIHYYKFRMYTPSPPYELVPGVATNEDIPIQKIYCVVPEGGDMTDTIGNPIIPYHISLDGAMYSDFMNVVLVTAPENYVANDFKSEGDIIESGATMMETDIILNIPVVPTGSTLQDPETKGTTKAPITETMVYYKGNEVWTYVFEVTDQTAYDYFTPLTRTTDNMDYGITVQAFASKTVVNAAPLWHFNQFDHGVKEGNGGGPNPAGSRNVIDVDRGDAGYSPLWEIFWMTKLPVNYMADQVSNADVVKANPELFTFFPAPMYVNCPDIGPVGPMNPNKVDAFQVDINPEDDNVIQGSHATLIMQAGKLVEFQCPTCTGLSTNTNMMGAFTYLLEASKVPEEEASITVVSGATDVFAIDIEDKMMMDPVATTPPTASASQQHAHIVAAFASIVGLFFSMM